MRDVVATLLRRDVAVEIGEMLVYFDDVHDHVPRVIEWTESLSATMVTAVFETNLTLQDYRLNLVIKKLTSSAGIIAVPTLVTGLLRSERPGRGQMDGARSERCRHPGHVIRSEPSIQASRLDLTGSHRRDHASPVSDPASGSSNPCRNRSRGRPGRTWWRTEPGTDRTSSNRLNVMA